MEAAINSPAEKTTWLQQDTYQAEIHLPQEHKLALKADTDSSQLVLKAVGCRRSLRVWMLLVEMKNCATHILTFSLFSSHTRSLVM
jgi:hypothetical protein